MGLLDFFSNPSSDGLLRSYENFGIDPNEVRRRQLQQGMLQAAAGMLQGNNLGTGLASGLSGMAQGAMAGRDAALQEGAFNYKIKQDQAKADRESKAWEGILAGNKYPVPGSNVPGYQPSTGPISPTMPGSPISHGLPTGEVGNFDDAVKFVLDQEGGYVEDDAGHGPSNFGINRDANPGVDIANLTRDQAIDIYRNKYWADINGDHLPPATALVAMDAAVNNGTEIAQQLLKETGGDPLKMIEGRIALYADLAKKPQYAAYADIWQKRMNDLTAKVAEMQGQGGLLQVADASGMAPAAMPVSSAAPRQTIEPYLSPGQQQAFQMQLQAAYASDDLNAAAQVQANAVKAAEGNAQRDMEAQGKAPQSRQRNEGDKVIEEEFDPRTGKWKKISEAPRWQPKAAEDENAGPFAGKSADSSALNIIYDYQNRRRRGETISSEDTTAYNIAIAKTAQLISDPVSGDQFIFSPITRQAVRLDASGNPTGEPFTFNGAQPGQQPQGGAAPQGQVGLSGRDIPGRSGTFDESSTVLEAAGEGTGFIAGLAQWWQATGGQIPGAPQADETVAAANGLRLFNQSVKQALVNNPRFPVAEQDVVAKMLPDPGALFSNPADQQNRIRQLYEYIKAKREQNTRALSTRGLSLERRRELMDQNQDLESAINLMQSMPIIGQAGGPDQPDVLKFDDNGELLRGSVRG